MAKKTPADIETQKKGKKAPKKSAPAADAVLEQVKKDFDNAWDYTKGSWHDRWTNNYKLYNNERVKIGYYGTSDTFVPMVYSTVETMNAALFGMKPRFNYLPPRNRSDQKTDILNSLVDYYWDKDQWSIKTINTGRGMLMRGTAVDYFCWDGDHPKMINVPIRDFFIDPTASSLENARFMGRRYLISKEELEEYEIVDLEAEPDKDGTHPMKKKYTNLDKLDEGESTQKQGQNVHGGENTDKQEKDIFYGSTIGKGSDQIEVIEWWGRINGEDRVVSVANRRVVIENSENYFKAKDRENGNEYPQALMPFAAARDIVDESLFYAKGEVDFIADLQEDLNDNKNQKKDAISLTLNQMYTLDPKYGDRIQEVINEQGVVLPFEAGALVPVPRAEVPNSAFVEENNIKDEIRETTGANEVVKGAQASGSPTATEINAQIAGAGQRLNLKVTQIENEYFHRVARIVFAMIRLYVTEKQMVRIIGKDGAKWEEFDPEEYKEGDYEPRVQLQVTIENQKAQFASQAKEMYAAFLNDPDVNQQELKKLVLAKGFQLDPDEVESLMIKPEEQLPADPMAGMPPTGAPVDPMMAGLPPDMPPLPPMPEEDMALMGGGEPYIDPVSGEVIPAEVMAMLEGQA